MLHADRRRLTAGRALPARRPRLGRGRPHVAGAVAVQVVLALFGEELDRAVEAVPGPQRPLNAEVVGLAGERGRLPAQHRRRVRVGVGHQPVLVQARHPPVHLGVGGQSGLDGEDVGGQVRVAVGDPVEPGLRAEHREPRRPRVRGHQVAPVAAGERDLEQVPRVEPEDRPAVRGEVADAKELPGDLVDRVKRRRVQQVVHLPGPVVALVDGGDLRRQQEADRRPARGRQRLVHRALKLRPQPEQPGRVWHQLGAELLPPRRVREVAGADHADPLTPGPPGQVLQVAVAAARPRELRVNMEVRVKAHDGHHLEQTRASSRHFRFVTLRGYCQPCAHPPFIGRNPALRCRRRRRHPAARGLPGAGRRLARPRLRARAVGQRQARIWDASRMRSGALYPGQPWIADRQSSGTADAP